MESPSQIILKIRRLGGRILAVGDDIECDLPPTVSQELKRELRERFGEVSSHFRLLGAALPPFQKPLITESACSLTQESWFNWSKSQAVQPANDRLAFGIHLHVGLNEAELAIRATVERHDALRQGLFVDHGHLLVQLLDPATFVFDICDEPHLSEEWLKKDANKFKGQAILPDGNWQLRVKLYRRPNGIYCLFSISHLIVDGHSVPLIRDAIYRSLNSLPSRTSTVTYLSYATHERSWFYGPKGRALVGYWLDRLRGQGSLYSPLTRKALLWCPGTRKQWEYRIYPAAQEIAFRAARGLNSTPFFVYLTAFVITMSRWTGEQRFPVRSSGSLRSTPPLWFLVGNMLTAEIMDCDLTNFAKFADLLKTLEVEHGDAVKLKIPNIFNFPAHPEFDGLEKTKLGGSVAATLNYFSNRSHLSKQGGGENMEEVGADTPIKLMATKAEKWSIPLWPIYLRMIETTKGTSCKFEFNETLISAEEQLLFIKTFFEQIENLRDLSSVEVTYR